MTEPNKELLTSEMRSDANSASRATIAAPEPPWALLVGGISGALWFFLFALLFGARWAIAVAAAAAIVALVRRMRIEAIAFVAAGALSAIGLVPSTTALFVASLAFGAGLATTARDAARAVARMGASDAR